MSEKQVNRILVATDGSPSARRAVDLGVELAEADDADVTFVHVVRGRERHAPRGARTHPVPRQLPDAGDEALDAAAAVAAGRGVRYERRLIAGEPADAIVSLADALDADLIVVGERRRRIRVRNVARRVSDRSTRPVLVARFPVPERDVAESGRPVVLALQGEAGDDADVGREAAALARRRGGALVALRVVPLDDPRVPRTLGPLSYLGPHELWPDLDDTRLAATAAAAREAGVSVRTSLVAAADPGGAIAEAAHSHRAAAVLVEAPGRGLAARLDGLLLARRVRRRAHVPVFTVGGRRPGRSR
jgi:nucleotide-binding universal stress UspA family protein